MDCHIFDQRQSKKNKAIKIILVNCVLWTTTFVGFHYITELFSINGGRFVAFIFAGPMFALYFSIVLGIKEQRSISLNEVGVTWGGHLSGFQSLTWEDMQLATLSGNDGVFNFRGGTMDEVITIPLFKFGASHTQRQRVRHLLNQYAKPMQRLA